MKAKISHYLEVKLLGVCGSLPGGGGHRQLMGVNSSCVQVTLKAGPNSDGETKVLQTLFLDAGTGLLNGDSIPIGDATPRYDIFLSHYHYDHILGLPFWPPLFRKESQVHLYGPTLEGVRVSEVLAQLMRPPFLPFLPDALQAQLFYHPVSANAVYNLEGLWVQTLPVSHPGGGLVYVIGSPYAEGTFAYLTDMDILKSPELIAYCRNHPITLAYADAHFFEAGYLMHPQWGHSAVEHLLDFQSQVGLGHLLLGHHPPARDGRVFKSQLEALMSNEYKDHKGLVTLAVEGDSYRV